MSIIAKQIVMFLTAGPLLLSTTAFADKAVEEEGYLTISEVSVDYESSTMMIIGSDLNFGPDPLQVILGGTDISSHCVLGDPMNDPQMIFCDGLALPVREQRVLDAAVRREIAQHLGGVVADRDEPHAGGLDCGKALLQLN